MATAKKTTTKAGQKPAAAKAATTGAKVEKIVKGSAKGDANVSATEKAGLKTKPGQGQKAAPAKGAKAAAAGQQGQRGRASEFSLETKVKADPSVETREGSFAAKICALAAKPTTLGALIDHAVSKRSEFFRSSAAAESADAARRALTVRIRDMIRAEYLTVV